MADDANSREIVAGLVAAQAALASLEAAEQAAQQNLDRAEQDKSQVEDAQEENDATRRRLSAAAYAKQREAGPELSRLRQEAIELADRLAGVTETLPVLERRHAVAKQKADAARERLAKHQDQWVRLRQQDVLDEIRKVFGALEPHVAALNALEDLHRPIEWGTLGINLAATVGEQLNKGFGHQYGGCFDLRPSWAKGARFDLPSSDDARQRFHAELTTLAQAKETEL